ncbi:MAG TPA: bifunctional 5,10-methylenetetrahydrofolate dehydrogenase/5,10-methenyltetrahydrofolate cyclohydrolase, partial [Myxococcota bacterium]|nr:bifunctional 5,10-methylenetetrahydrofolate dehydrogenase/5,10-methenyltetrahydrofolate cyclohydrolase [Myxococcota bacterium]
GLAVVLVGADPASQVYVRRKGKVAEKLGYLHRQIDLPADAPRADLLAVLRELGDDRAIDGILVQFPLPRREDEVAVLDALPPEKDVDGFTAVNLGLLASGRPRLVACTPAGVMRLIAESGVSPAGLRAAVIGRSNIVGRPMAMLLEQANATVTVCHSHTPALPEVVREADIVVAAVGRPELVRAGWVKPGAVVIDVGMNRLPTDDGRGRLVGDVAFDEVAQVAAAITPVPGGVGPMTITTLMENTLRAMLAREGLA